MYLSSKLTLPSLSVQHLQSKQRRVCCESWATVWNLGKKAQRKEYLLKKWPFLSKRAWSVQLFSKASWQKRKLWADNNTSPPVFVTNGVSLEAIPCRPMVQRAGTQQRCRELVMQQGIVTRSSQLQPESCQHPNYWIYNSLVMSTVCSSCDAASP